MKKGLDEIQAELTALIEALGLIDRDHKDGTLSSTFYYKRRVSLVRDRELTMQTLKDILTQNDAAELSNVLDKVLIGAENEEIDEELLKAQEAGNSKGWGEVLKKEISDRKGSMVKTAMSAAMKVAQFLIE